MKTLYADSMPGRPKSEWHPLPEHLEDTAERAERFTESFASGWGRPAGLLHDAGKYLSRFQRRIDDNPLAHSNDSVDHACVGALIASEKRLSPLAWVIASHHTGLKNKVDISARLSATRDSLAEARRDGLPAQLEEFAVPKLPAFKTATAAAFWARFLFSALVDADFLDTEAFYKTERVPPTIDLHGLLSLLEERLAKFSADTPLNHLRAALLEDCRDASQEPPGYFTLTVPTGGGKTLASMLFALLHAVRYKRRRVIVVIPYTSIIDQTAKVYRDIFGAESVIEHHTNVDPDKETQQNRLAAENWDASIVVTTSVQFFESLYANRTSRCRKLHNIAQSVVIFDEVQTFPVNLLEAVNASVRNLVSSFGVTAVFCTATQPALGFEAREIAKDHRAFFAAVSGRFQIHMPASDEPVSYESLASEIIKEEQVLAIVHRRDDAAMLASLVPDSIHLSARMCASHRIATLAIIREKLSHGEKCRVIATQLVEAGVDVDFPVVFRAFAGADSMAQAGGRCNREGRRATGHLRIFIPPTPPPRGILSTAQELSFVLKRQEQLDLLDPSTFSLYFRRLYTYANKDAKGVIASETEFSFEDSAEKFKMIEDAGTPIVCPCSDSAAVVSEFNQPGDMRKKLRRLQRFLVNVYPNELRALELAGAVASLPGGLRLFQLLPAHHHLYSNHLGLIWPAHITAEPSALIA